jgi:hypothetical protein
MKLEERPAEVHVEGQPGWGFNVPGNREPALAGIVRPGMYVQFVSVVG